MTSGTQYTRTSSPNPPCSLSLYIGTVDGYRALNRTTLQLDPNPGGSSAVDQAAVETWLHVPAAELSATEWRRVGGSFATGPERAMYRAYTVAIKTHCPGAARGEVVQGSRTFYVDDVEVVGFHEELTWRM